MSNQVIGSYTTKAQMWWNQSGRSKAAKIRSKRHGEQQVDSRRFVVSCRVLLLSPLLLLAPLRALTRAYTSPHPPRTHHKAGMGVSMGMAKGPLVLHAPPTARSRRSGLCGRPAWLLMRAPLAHKWLRGSVLGAFVAGLGALMVFVRCRTVLYGVWFMCRSVCRTVLVRSRVRMRRAEHPPLTIRDGHTRELL